MLVFVTGATGYIGTAVSAKLLAAGHRVLGLARSDASAQTLAQRGLDVARGNLHDAASITAAAARADAAIHLAMEFTAEAAALDVAAIGAILAGLGTAAKPFVYTSGIWVLGSTGAAGADESSPLNPVPIVAWRPAHERRVLEAAGVHGIVIRPGMVYGHGGGFAGGFRRAARAEGVVRYVGDGANRWPFVHVDDLADLYVRALAAPAGSLYFAAAGSYPVERVARAAAHGVRLEAIPLNAARAQMGPMADALVLDQTIVSTKAARELGWQPAAQSVIAELEESE